MLAAARDDPETVLLQEIEAFLRETGMGASTFGRKAMADSTFVHELRRGRNLYAATENKARTQIGTYRQLGRFDHPQNEPTAPKLRREWALSRAKAARRGRKQ